VYCGGKSRSRVATVEPAGIREKSRRSGAFARFIAKIHKIVGPGRNVTKSMDSRKSSRMARRGSDIIGAGRVERRRRRISV
jgi:hypothetical protein